MSNKEMTFDEVINALLENAQHEEDSLDNQEIDEGEKHVVKVLLRGYRKALMDIKEVYSNESTSYDDQL